MVLRPMSQEEFDQYMHGMLPQYADEKQKSIQCSPEEARKIAEAEIKGLLPQGLTSENHYFYCLVEEGVERMMGYLWLQLMIKPTRKTVFICDFSIMEEYRGQGYGKQAMQALDEEVRRLGAGKISLHVFAHNERAIALYQKMGFEFTNHYMAKTV